MELHHYVVSEKVKLPQRGKTIERPVLKVQVDRNFNIKDNLVSKKSKIVLSFFSSSKISNNPKSANKNKRSILLAGNHYNWPTSKEIDNSEDHKEKMKLKLDIL